MTTNYRLWVNNERTVKIELWPIEDRIYLATRATPGDVWGPPVVLVEEIVHEQREEA